MIRKFLIPVLALAGLIFAIQTVASGARPVPVAAPIADPAPSPFEATIAGAGIVEAMSQNVAVGTPVPGIVVDVPVRVGETVQSGAPLFRIDDRDARARLDVQKATLAAAQADLARLVSLPRAEDVPPAVARVAVAEASLADARRQLEVAESLDDKRAMAVEEWSRRRFAVQSLEARVAEARAELDKIQAGAWESEVAVQRARIATAEAGVHAAEVDLERLVVRAPLDCTVLQLNVRKGEFAPAGVTAVPLVLVGDVSRLHVRVDVDENDAWRLAPGAQARGFVRGNSKLSTDLEFVRVEPYVVPKRSLTGESSERVDTRVLQVLFRFDPQSLPVYVGQQMDVFVETTRAPDASTPRSSKPGDGR